MSLVNLSPDSRGYTYVAIDGLIAGGWKIVDMPEDGQLQVNRQLMRLLYRGRQEVFRLMIFKVSGSGRGRAGERRIEITSTYLGGRLQPQAEVVDLLLGYDPITNVFVGFDSRRLSHGGQTENASAFIDAEGLRLASANRLVVLPRTSDLFGFEYHAFFRPRRLAEYILNRFSIHSGEYSGQGLFSGVFRRRQSAGSVQVDASHSVGAVIVLESPVGAGRTSEPSIRDVEIVSSGQPERLASRRITPEQFSAMLLASERNGALGEYIALEHERRRLANAGRIDLVSMIRWTSKENVCAGFDIMSFEIDGSQRFIEVKATSGHGNKFAITRNEWRVARLKRDRYWIYLVTNVNAEPAVVEFQDPLQMEAAGTLVREPDGWTVTIDSGELGR